MQYENKIYTKAEMQDLGIYTGNYHYNKLPGVFDAELILKAEGRSGMIRVFFLFEDGRKIIAPVYWFNQYLGMNETSIGSKVMLTYTENARGIYLTGSEVVD